MNAKYNALLIAREDIEVAKEYMALIHEDNFEGVLPIYFVVDSNRLDSAKFFLIDAVKKASLIAEKHSNSKYLDEAYLRIGEARVLKGEYENAIEVYKYLNSESESESVITEALSQMMRAYLELDDLQNATKLSDMLRSRSLSKDNHQTFLLNEAYFRQKNDEEAVVVLLLEEAVKIMKRGPEKGRMHFILGQLYDNLGQIPLARRNYRLVKKNKSDYDLVFNADLGLKMNESLANNTDLLFEDMLNDRKNQDLKHKIYYKMGEMSRRKREPENAIKYFILSKEEISADETARGFAYKAIADVYLDDLNDYENAAVYYDSTVITLPKEFLNRLEIKDRAAYLNEFIKYRKVFALEDSLQNLAKLSPEILDYTLEKIVKEKREVARAAKELTVQGATQSANSPVSQPQGNIKKWRLYDPQQLIREQNEFVRIWGNRRLEDNWRRTEKSSSTFVFNDESRKMVEQVVIQSADTAQAAQVLSANTPVFDEENERKIVEQEVKELKNRVPVTMIQLMASKRKQEEAAFQIAKIYKLKFKDDNKANESFRNFLNDFPRSSYMPEVLYYLSLAESDPLNNVYAERLIREFPHTSFGRQLRRGVVVMTEDREIEAANKYGSAFTIYDRGEYPEVITYLEECLTEYVGSQVEDKMALLRIYALAKEGMKDEYLISLNDFVRAYPRSDLLPTAQELLKVIDE